MKFNRFSLCFFDVLGFETRFSDLGLDGMLRKYVALVDLVDARNEHMGRLFGEMGFKESAYWLSDGDAFVVSRLHGAYASDSLLVWTHTDFPEARHPAAVDLAPAERERRASEPAEGWLYHPIPCDNLLDICNEMICHSLEIGLPLRGALALGEAVLHIECGVYLGQPLIDAARMEHSQRIIGASFTRSFMKQIVPPRYLAPFDKHLKNARDDLFQGSVLDWPRHWRATRKADLRAIIRSLNTLPAAADIYDNTLCLIDVSEASAEMFDRPEDMRLGNAYPQFSTKELALRACAVKRITGSGRE
ncbi:hypothetical protein [Burkholderia pseudomallei]|uniref:hypothetical protein n=1 Tax=Burkholderia pseudomallei TaxID=28450 RepID=UPI0009CD6C56|nr:hypothetical protein [Burkholderia pseudomallei]OMT02653.1 hypothetical protein AQ750_23670 [Burkholderia pseudomallei]OMV23581.1 hypothetical protein AQ787_19530 [Burkholderia pseudomallei]CAJ3681743.1 Uncharacterised protein [Burkholderia pseudomallei]CAJ4123692.1 Uncharacterised protein [Burkholderia pseudomallei]CAJ5015495.1 Uncharacterised protein [Burkholderia pseudomallei]